MLFAIDTGNTSISLGVYDDKKLLAFWRMKTDKDKTSDEIGIYFLSLFEYSGINYRKIDDVIICSVVPSIMHHLVNAVKKYIKKQPIIVGPGLKTGINIKYENPREVGADRIVDAAGALHLYKSSVIVVDFGTATTFNAVKQNGDYLGGVICPGIQTAAESLFEKTSKLPRIDINKPRAVIGRNTAESIQAGMIYGYAGQVNHIVSLIKKEMKEENIKVIATGGLAKLIAEETNCIDEVNRMLTMEGLRIIREMNTGKEL